MQLVGSAAADPRVRHSPAPFLTSTPGEFSHLHWLSPDSPHLQTPGPLPLPRNHQTRGSGSFRLPPPTFSYSLGLCSCPGPGLLSKEPPSNPSKDNSGPPVVHKPSGSQPSFGYRFHILDGAQHPSCSCPQTTCPASAPTQTLTPLSSPLPQRPLPDCSLLGSESEVK